MTNKDFALEKIQEIIDALIDIKKLMIAGGVPQNEEWIKAAMPMNEIMYIMGNYRKVKDNEYCEI